MSERVKNQRSLSPNTIANMGENDAAERPNEKWQCERQVGQQQRNKRIRGGEKEPIEYDWCGTS